MRILKYLLKPPIYQRIKAALRENGGTLPLGFAALPESPETKIRLLPGAKEGMLLHHMDELPQDTAGLRRMMALLHEACEHPEEDYDEAFAALLEELSLLLYLDDMMEAVNAEDPEWDIQRFNMIDIAYRWAVKSDNPELVKLGVALLGMVNLSDEAYAKHRKAIFTLGKCEEFSLYSLYAISGWEASTALTFELAQSLRGWGKILAMEWLSPETPEIKEWILKEGCQNDISDAYLGLVCAEKGDLIAALRKETPDSRLFLGMSTIMDALVSEETVAGIGEYQYADEAIDLYLGHAALCAQSLRHLRTVVHLCRWLQKEQMRRIPITDVPEKLSRCRAILSGGKWKREVQAALQSGDAETLSYACLAAETLELDIRQPLFDRIARDPMDLCEFAGVLYKDPEYAPKLTALYQERMPLSELASGPGDILGFGSESKAERCLDMVLQELCNYPLQGIKLVEAGLRSPVIRNRNSACNVLECWERRRKQAVGEFLPDLLPVLDGVLADEPDAALRQRIVYLFISFKKRYE